MSCTEFLFNWRSECCVKSFNVSLLFLSCVPFEAGVTRNCGVCKGTRQTVARHLLKVSCFVHLLFCIKLFHNYVFFFHRYGVFVCKNKVIDWSCVLPLTSLGCLTDLTNLNTAEKWPTTIKKSLPALVLTSDTYYTGFKTLNTRNSSKWDPSRNCKWICTDSAFNTPEK